MRILLAVIPTYVNSSGGVAILEDVQKKTEWGT